MRILGAGFGLLALLICVAIMLWLSAENASTVIPVGRKAQEDAEKIAGMSNGIHSADSVTLEPGGDGSRTTYLKVTKVVAGGPMANYGLQLNDRIIEVGPFSVRDATDTDLIKANVWEAPQRQMPITVLRNGRQVTLPQAATPAAGSGGRSPLDTQLDVLQQNIAR